MFDIICVADEVWLCKAEEEWRPPGPKIILCIPECAANAAAVNPRGIKTVLAS